MNALLPCGHTERHNLLPTGECDACLDAAWFREQDIAFDGIDHCAQARAHRT